MDFDRTTGRVAREAGVTPATVRLYADLGALPHRIASNGTRLFDASAAQLVRDLLVQRLANRGRKSSAAPVAA
jgi:DNA-binding transcriptional MerR regulator